MQAPPASFVLGKSPRLWFLIMLSATLCLLAVFVRVRRADFLRSVGKVSGRVLLTLVITVVLFEAAGFTFAQYLPIRLVLLVPDWVKTALPESAFERADFRMLRRSEKVADKRMGWLLSPNQDIELRYLGMQVKQITDSNGFANTDETLYSHADILVVGDSFTQGLLVDYQLSWPRQLADLTDLRVLNMGISGYGLPHYAFLLERWGLRVRPNIIIAGLFNNDVDLDFYHYQDYVFRHPNISGYDEYLREIQTNQTFQVWQYPDPHYPNWLSVVTRNALVPISWVMPFTSATIEFITQQFRAQPSDASLKFNLDDTKISMNYYQPYGLSEPIPTPQQRLRHDFEALVRLAVASGGKLYLVYIPTASEVYVPLLREATNLNALAQRLADEYNSTGSNSSAGYSTLHKLASLSGTPLYDATPYLQEKARTGEQLNLEWDPHPSPLGHLRIAEFVQSIMTDEGAKEALHNNRMP